MTDLALLLDDDQIPDEPWHIDVIDRDPAPEEKRQLKFLRDMKMLAPAVNVFAVPNAGRRTQWEIAKAKREGMKAGVLDLVVTWNRGVAFLEFKDGRSKPTPAQRHQLNTLYRQGHHCGVFRTSASALRFLQERGCPFLFPPTAKG
jgi:hypothetical protein